jgi:hypothetical protein
VSETGGHVGAGVAVPARAAGSDASVESWPDVGVTFLSTHRREAFWPVPRRRAESVRKDQKDKKDQKEMT